MMRGVIDFLLSNTKESNLLRENFVFKIIPMLNPDGVIHGNYRCSLIGADLNRRWKFPNKCLHPTIASTKKLIKQFSKERELVLICDLHGHSRKPDVFMYGNHIDGEPEVTRAIP
jgi:murein tripeptide amidase MpaA